MKKPIDKRKLSNRQWAGGLNARRADQIADLLAADGMGIDFVRRDGKGRVVVRAVDKKAA